VGPGQPCGGSVVPHGADVEGAAEGAGVPRVAELRELPGDVLAPEGLRGRAAVGGGGALGTGVPGEGGG